MKIKEKQRPKEKSPRAKKRGQLIQEPAAFRALEPRDRQAIEDYFKFHPLAKRGR